MKLSALRLALALLAGLGLTALAPAGEEKTTEKKAEARVEKGKPAPDVELPATGIDKILPEKKGAKTISLKDFQGKKNVVLYFYPKAMTKGCTKESCTYRDLTKEFDKLDTVILGISTDTLEDQLKFTDKEMLNFPLLADPEKKVTEAFGALSTSGRANRYTFVIDKQGIVREIYTKVDPETNPGEVLKFIKDNLTK